MIKQFKKIYANARAHIFLSISKEQATLLTSLLIGGATTLDIWENLKET